MKPTLNKPSNKTTRGATGGANANASAPTEEPEPGCAKEEDMLTAGMFTKALDSLKSDICSKIELAVGGLQTDIAAVREELTSSVATIQRSLEEQDGRLQEVESPCLIEPTGPCKLTKS